MKKLFTLFAFAFLCQTAFASSIYEYYLDTKLNGVTKNHGNYNTGLSFNGDNLGAITAKPATLVIDLVGIKTNANSGDNYNTVTMFYRVYQGAPGAYLSVNLPNISNPSGSGNAEFQQPTDVNLLSLPNMVGTYSVDVYFVANATFTGGGGGTFTSNATKANGSPTEATAASPMTATFTVNSVTLASEMTSFSAKKNSSSSELSWLTASEKDNAVFQIERSASASGFSKIGEMKGAGNSNAVNNYTFTDVSPLSGVNYYRLKAVDFSGAATFSKVVSVDFAGKGGNKTTVYPNPTRDVLRVEFTAADVSTTMVQVTDVVGRVLLSQNATVVKGANFVPLNVSSLPSGAYFVKINNDVTRFVKL